MLKTKKTKFLLVLAMVFTLLLPYATPVMAETLQVKEDVELKQLAEDPQTLKITSSEAFKCHDEGIQEVGKYFSYVSQAYNQQQNNGNSNAHFYQPLHADETGAKLYDYTFYCIDASKTIPQRGSEEIYSNGGNFFDLTAQALGSQYNVTGFVSNNESESIRKYNSVRWILQNAFIDFDSSDAFLNKVFSAEKNVKSTIRTNDDEIELVEWIKGQISEEDIHMLQQAAIWHFTNPTGANSIAGIIENSQINNYSNYPAGYNPNTSVTDIQTAYHLQNFRYSYSEMATANDGIPVSSAGYIQKIYDMIYSYLVANAENAGSTTPTVVNPVLDDTITATYAIETISDENFYKFGPFKTKNDIENANVDMQVLDNASTPHALSNYKVVKSNNEVISTNSITYSQVSGNEFYVLVPQTENITGIAVAMVSHEGNSVVFWHKDGKQPLVSVEKNSIQSRIPVSTKVYDLALRKYIKAIDGVELAESRAPKVDATVLIGNSDKKTAIYKHSKNPVEISVDSKITYTLNIYNEGETDAVIKEIKDYIPEGMELAEGNLGWSEENGVATYNTGNVNLPARDDSALTAGKDTETGGLSMYSVDITLQIKDSAKASMTSEKILTNIAEISDTNGNAISSEGEVINNIDRDSTPSNFPENSKNNDYSGVQSTDDGYIAGMEDDDDFDKVKIIIEDNPTIDLALKKFITSINGKKLTGDESREPKVNTQPLKDYLNGTSSVSDAEYTMPKNAVKIKKGDIITYTIRVYNEGNVDAYAQQVTDYIPEGLGYLVAYEANTNFDWSLVQYGNNNETISVSDIDNAVENLKKINPNVDPNHQTVVQGALTINTSKLSYSSNTENVINAFDGGKNLSYKDVEVTCVVLADEVKGDNLKNLAEITGHAIVNKDGTVTEYIGPDDKGIDKDSELSNAKTKHEDDDDYEKLTLEENKIYDLALQKFITAVDGKAVTDREPTVTVDSNGTVKYNHSTQSLSVANGQLVEYTIRVYNEGNVETIAAQVADDLPNGLEFLPDNKTNKDNGWKMYDKNGKETTNINAAVTVRTNKLDGANNAIEGFDPTKDAKPKSKDLKIVFKVNESVISKTKDTEQRTIINTAEITKETDKDGTDVTDQDSTPNNWNENEDDLDKERIYVKYFDLELEKKLVKVIVAEGGKVTEYDLNDDTLFKVELNKKKLGSTVVKFVYEITVTNKGEIDGYAKEIKDYIPDGLEFVAEDNAGWYTVGTNVVATEALAQTLLAANGGSASTFITLKWQNSTENMGKKINIAEISKDANEFDSPDVDSTPDNQNPDEDDIDAAPVLLGISTGAEKSYTGLIIAVAVIMTTGVVLIKKYVL